MDIFLVGIIVLAAALFTIRGFIRIYKGEAGCGCSSGGCGCSGSGSGSECCGHGKDSCGNHFPLSDNR